MDPFVRRVYFSLGTVLAVLWFGMLALAVHAMKPEMLSLTSAPAPLLPESLPDLSPDLGASGIRFSTYHTAPGDTFLSLSQKFRLSEETLRSLNQANDNTQPAAETLLLIPSKDGIFHMVRPGQTLADIARAYGLPLRDILKSNPQRGDADVKPGDVLYLPGASYLTRQDMRWVALAALADQKGFLKPTTGRFADGFGMRLHPITHKMAFHEGLDLAPGWGARVVASQDGKVLFAAIRAGYGRLIILDHGGGLTSYYAHLDEILVKPGQFVKRGALIGKVGNSGRTTGPHLHFEVRLNGKPRNPLLYLAQ
ncbi:MAG TPA: M23 family metallopeptidase [bacterium]|nr:M23 family metallopeptidase [bacterium]